MRAKKSLGQNFLKSPAIINKMVVAGEVTDKDIVIEIGPGKGALTTALLGHAKKVIAIEKDPELVLLLSQKFKEDIEKGKLVVLEKDALEVDLSTYLGNKPYKVVANIPYYITGALLRTFLSGKIQPQALVFLMQKEVADRILARDGKESILSLSVKAYGTPSYVQKVSAKAFTPSPNVDSAILKVSNVQKTNFADENEEVLFFKLIKTGFAHKRKTVLKNLSELLPKEKIATVLEKQNLDQKVRAEDIPLVQWLDMTKELKIVYYNQ